MAGFAALPALLGHAGLFYALFSTALSAVFVAMSFWLFIAPDARQAAASKALFAYSILYLFLLFAGFPADKLIGI
jgi:protoheme IX farnesyltransferase